MTTEKKRVRVKGITQTGAGTGRPRKDLQDVNKDEVYEKAPSVSSFDEMLLNDVAKDLFKSASSTLVHRQQLKPSHLSLLISYANSFAVTVMTPVEMEKYNLTKLRDDGTYYPPIHSVFTAYNNAMIKAMQNLRLDPRTELMNSLQVETNKKGTEYLATKNLYDEM